MIRIPNGTFMRLQALATPFTDTPSTVIDRLLAYWDAGHPTAKTYEAPDELVASATNVKMFSAMNPPDLHHTRFIDGEVGDLAATSWNSLVAAAHIDAIANGFDFEKLKQNTISNIREGRYTKHGFKFYSDMDVSIQNVDANNAWRHAFHLAKRFDRLIRVEFEWRNKDAAAYPGVQGKIEWVP